MRINPILYGVLVVVLFFGIIFGFQTAGVWTTSGKTDSSGKSIEPLADDVSTIKGWMTLELITKVYEVPLAEILAQFDLPADTPAATAIKDLETETFSNELLGEWLMTRGQTNLTPQPVAATPETNTIADATTSVTEHVAADKTITGSTTFQDLLDWGVTKEAIEKAIGETLPTPSTIIKDYASSKGVGFGTLKTQLQAEVDRLK